MQQPGARACRASGVHVTSVTREGAGRPGLSGKDFGSGKKNRVFDDILTGSDFFTGYGSPGSPGQVPGPEPGRAARQPSKARANSGSATLAGQPISGGRPRSAMPAVLAWQPGAGDHLVASAIVAPWVKAQTCSHTAVGFPNMAAA